MRVASPSACLASAARPRLVSTDRDQTARLGRMSMTYRTLRTALVAATALTFFAAPAAAQQIDRIVAFGDSYADDNNAFASAITIRARSLSIPPGAFRAAPTISIRWAQILQVPIENFAIGGRVRRHQQRYLVLRSAVRHTLCGRGLQYEVDQFLNVGTQSAVFPRRSRLRRGRPAGGVDRRQ